MVNPDSEVRYTPIEPCAVDNHPKPMYGLMGRVITPQGWNSGEMQEKQAMIQDEINTGNRSIRFKIDLTPIEKLVYL